MTTLQLNAEIYEALSVIAQDESLLKKAARSLKRLASMKKEATLMSEEEFFEKVDKAREQIRVGNSKKMLQDESLDDFLVRNGYV
jgi:hypothetical protein